MKPFRFIRKLSVAIGIAMCLSLCAAMTVTAEEHPVNPYREIIMNMTDEEVVEIQQVLCLEAGIDTWEGRVATAQVIFNRVLSDKFPKQNTVHEVLSQTKPCIQYATYRRRHTADYGERESDAIEFLCNCEVDELYIGFDRLFQDCKPIGKDPIKVGKQYFGK